MTLEQSLAAREIKRVYDLGFGANCAISAAKALVKSQGFGADHSEAVALEMWELLDLAGTEQ